MKNKCHRPIIIMLLFILFYHSSPAQNCYTSYKNQGDNYKRLADGFTSPADLNKRQANYSLARQQYQIARNCSYLTNAQRIEIDRLLATMNDKLKAPARVTTIIRRT